MVAIVTRAQGSTEFHGATAVLDDDGSIAIVYANPESERFEETWDTIPAGTWRDVAVYDASGYPLFTFISPAYRATIQAAVAAERSAHACDR